MKPDRESIIIYINLIIDSIDAVFEYLKGVEEKDFISNEQLQDACLMRLIVIGEYAAKIPEEVQQQYPEIEWRDMKAARNFYVHVYLSVGWQQIWETIQTKLPDLRNKLVTIRLDEN